MTTRMDKEWNRFDAATHAVSTVEYEHKEIHSGTHFFIANYGTVASSATVDFAITTPNTTRWGHMTFSIEGQGELSMHIYEDSDYDSDGTAVIPVNNNRNSTNTSVLTIQTDPTVNSDGNQKFAKYSGGNRIIGLISRERELVLKQNTKYIFRITNQSAQNNIISWDADWYEHVNKS